MPNEWVPSWNYNALKAGAVIIRSGVYWRVNRSALESDWPNNNCYGDKDGSNRYYRTVPNSRGGEEEWLPHSAQRRTTSATNATSGFHAELNSTPSDRPDPLVSLRYNSVIQHRTNNANGSWSSRIRSAYVDQPYYDENTECSQTDYLTNSNPSYPNY